MRPAHSPGAVLCRLGCFAASRCWEQLRGWGRVAGKGRGRCGVPEAEHLPRVRELLPHGFIAWHMISHEHEHARSAREHRMRGRHAHKRPEWQQPTPRWQQPSHEAAQRGAATPAPARATLLHRAASRRNTNARPNPSEPASIALMQAYDIKLFSGRGSMAQGSMPKSSSPSPVAATSAACPHTSEQGRNSCSTSVTYSTIPSVSCSLRGLFGGTSQ